MFIECLTKNEFNVSNNTLIDEIIDIWLIKIVEFLKATTQSEVRTYIRINWDLNLVKM